MNPAYLMPMLKMLWYVFITKRQRITLPSFSANYTSCAPTIHMPKAPKFTAQPSQRLGNIGASTIPTRHRFIAQKGLNFDHTTGISCYKVPGKSIKRS
jgi:hypothetical protein